MVGGTDGPRSVSQHGLRHVGGTACSAGDQGEEGDGGWGRGLSIHRNGWVQKRCKVTEGKGVELEEDKTAL